MILGKVLRSELDTRLREMAKDIFPSSKGEKVWKGKARWSDEARMRGFGPRMSKILDVFVRKVYVVHCSSNQ